MKLLTEKDVIFVSGAGGYTPKSAVKSILGGGATGAATGFFAGGPAGAFVGAHVGVIGGGLKWIITGK